MRKAVLFSIGVILSLLVNSQVRKIVVAADGSGNFKTVHEAFNAVPVNNKKPVIIFIKNGVYREKLILDSTKQFVTLEGEDKFNTILTYDDHTGKVAANGDTINTYTSASFLEGADNFSAENISFENNAGFSAGQAVAIRVLGDKTQFHNCRFIGNQDVLFSSQPNTRQFFQDCYIEGTTDFIFGPSTAWFEQCHIHSKKNSHVTAASTPKENKFGYIFHDCILTADSALNKVTLGRPWRPYSSVVYIYCYIDKHIVPVGWSNWNNTENFKTARYAEYKNYGPGSSIVSRAEWSHQLTDEEARQYVMKNVLGNWKPIVK